MEHTKPTLDIGDIQNPIGLWLAVLRVKALMSWPSDINAQEQYIVSFIAKTLGEHDAEGEYLNTEAGFQENLNSDDQLFDDWENRRELLTDIFNAYGGFRLLSLSPGITTFEAMQDEMLGRWMAAGYVLALVRRMATHHPDLDGGASVNKAVHILETCPPPGLIFNTKDIRQSWSEFKAVAHLCAAYLDIFLHVIESGDYESDDDTLEAFGIFMEGNFWKFLALSDAYYEFGTKHQPPRRKGEFLLPPASTWKITYRDTGWRVKMETAPLEGDWLRAAQDYRAPKRL